MSAGLGQNPVTISCTIRGDNIFLLINGTLIDHLNYAEYDSLGITVHGSSGNSTSSMLTQNVTFKVSVDVNNTNITCIGSAEGSDNAESYIAIITIAGKIYNVFCSKNYLYVIHRASYRAYCNYNNY